MWFCSSTWICGSSGIASAQPPSLNSRLPIGRRGARSAGRQLVSIARMPLPMFAPSTRPSATVTGRMPEAASVAVSSTIARLE